MSSSDPVVFFEASIAGRVFRFRKLRRVDFVAVQNVLGIPGVTEGKPGDALMLAVECAQMDKARGLDLREALDECPGAINQSGGKLYAAATASQATIVGESDG